MNPLAREWLGKAEGDYTTALRELRARKKPNYDSACFHAQQCVEKYLKGILQASDIVFGKTHDLCLLLDFCLGEYPLWESYRPDMEMLTQYAVAFRYPGASASRGDAKRAVDAAGRLRDVLRKAAKGHD